MSDQTTRIILISGLFMLTLIWRITSDYPLKTWIRNITKPYGSVVLIFEFLIILQVLGLINFNFIKDSDVFRITGLLIFILGFFLSIWAKIIMRGSWGVPAQHDGVKQNKLITSPPFTFSRNPIYVGLLMVFAGLQIAIGSYAVFLIIPLFMFVRKAVSIEEALLEKHFGKIYAEYKKKVPRFL